MATIEPIAGLVLPDPGVPGVFGSGDPIDRNVDNKNLLKIAALLKKLPTDPMIAYKTAEPANNTTTLIKDADLVVTTPFAGQHRFDLRGWFRSSATGDFKFTFKGDGSGLLDANIRFSTMETGGTMVFGGSNVSVLVGDAGFHAFHATGAFNTTAPGSLSLWWAQNTSDGAATTAVLLGSLLSTEFVK